MNTINQQIETIINDKLERDIVFPTIVTITRVYENRYCDVKNETYGELRHIQSITPHEIGDKTLLVFGDNEYGNRILI